MEKNEQKKSQNKKPKIGVAALIIGVVACIAGLVFLLVNLLAEPGLRDAEYLVSVGKWQREDKPSVVWDFTEVGKGSLTTDNHINDYDFIWAISGDKLEIETEWLYILNDEFEYEIDQQNKVLTLNGDIKFRPASSVDAEITEDN